MLPEWRSSEANPVCVGVRAGMGMVDPKPVLALETGPSTFTASGWKGFRTAGGLELEVGNLFRNGVGSVFWGKTVGFWAW